MSPHAKQKSFFVLFRILALSTFLTVLLAASSTYLALKIGILPSASIPAAILAMALLRLFHYKSIHETNLIQTAASAGEAVAGGIVFTIPALVIIGYWHHFPYWINVVIALSSGVLGILFSIPLRKILLNAPPLRFPEARAITAVLQASHQQAFPVREMLTGAGLGALFEFLQTGIKFIASAAEKWLWINHSTMIIGFGVGFSPALMGVGYLVGLDLGLSLFCGALIGCDTPMYQRVIQQFQEKVGSSENEIRARVAASLPLKRVGQADEVAQVVRFLCSDAASFMTGASVNVDGGYTIQ